MNSILNIIPTEYSLKLLDILYHRIKKVSPKYYENGKMNDEYKELKQMILKTERKIKLDYICDTKIEKKEIKSIKLNQYSREDTKYKPEEILDLIVSRARQRLISGMDVNQYFDNIDVTNECDVSSSNVSIICKNLFLHCEKIRIEAGYDNQLRLFNGSGYHCFNIVSIYEKKYLIDCTYKQFFKTDRSSLERLGIPLLDGTYPGTFMLLNEERKKIANTLLKQGWIEVTDENLKHYFDGFTLSFRNGSYYEKFGTNYETNYTKEDYIRFITTSESLLDHEDIEYLGFQQRPLDDYRLKFKK